MPPPGPAYGFLCVASSVFRVLSNAAEIRAAQLARNAGAQEATHTRPGRRVHIQDTLTEEDLASPALILKTRPKVTRKEASQDASHPPDTHTDYTPTPIAEATLVADNIVDIPSSTPIPADEAVELSESSPARPLDVETERPDVRSVDAATVTGIPTIDAVSLEQTSEPPAPPPKVSHLPFSRHPQVQRNLQSSKVPSSRIGRLFHYGGACLRPIEIARSSLMSVQVWQRPLAMEQPQNCYGERRTRTKVRPPYMFPRSLTQPTRRQQPHEQLPHVVRRQCQTPRRKAHQNARSSA